MRRLSGKSNTNTCLCHSAESRNAGWMFRDQFLHKATFSVKCLYLRPGAGDLFALSGTYWQIVDTTSLEMSKTLWRIRRNGEAHKGGLHGFTCNITKIVSNSFANCNLTPKGLVQTKNLKKSPISLLWWRFWWEFVFLNDLTILEFHRGKELRPI